MNALYFLAPFLATNSPELPAPNDTPLAHYAYTNHAISRDEREEIDQAIAESDKTKQKFRKKEIIPPFSPDYRNSVPRVNERRILGSAMYGRKGRK